MRTLPPRPELRDRPAATSSPRRLTALALTAVLCLLASGAGPGVAYARAEGDAAAAGATDVLVLKDGRRLEGTCIAESDDGVTFRANGATRFYPRDQIERRERGAAPVPAPDAPAAQPAGDSAAPATQPGSTPESAPKPDAVKKTKTPKALSDESRAWVRELAGKATTQDETVRRSLAAALRACGPTAVPTIREVAASQADPAAKAFLESVAAEMSMGKSERGPKGPAAAAGESKATESEMGGAPAAGDAPRKPDLPGAGKRPEAGRGRGGLFEKLSQELELREDQRQPFMAFLGGMERARGQAVKELENGGSVESARTKIAEIRTTTLDGARGILDAGQMEAFDLVAERFFGEMEMRLEKLASKRAPGGQTLGGEPKKDPAPDGPQAPK